MRQLSIGWFSRTELSDGDGVVAAADDDDDEG